jgi:hypothetical protein
MHLESTATIIHNFVLLQLRCAVLGLTPREICQNKRVCNPRPKDQDPWPVNTPSFFKGSDTVRGIYSRIGTVSLRPAHFGGSLNGKIAKENPRIFGVLFVQDSHEAEMG